MINYNEMKERPNVVKEQYEVTRGSGSKNGISKKFLAGYCAAILVGTAAIWGISEYTASRNREYHRSQESKIEKFLNKDFNQSMSGNGGGTGGSGGADGGAGW